MVWQYQDSWQKKPFCFLKERDGFHRHRDETEIPYFRQKTAGRQMTSRELGGSEMELDGVSSRFGGRAQMEHTTRVTRVELWSAIKHYPPCREHYWSEWRTSRAQIFPFVQSSIVCWINQNLTQPSQRGDRAPICWGTRLRRELTQSYRESTEGDTELDSRQKEETCPQVTMCVNKHTGSEEAKLAIKRTRSSGFNCIKK